MSGVSRIAVCFAFGAGLLLSGCMTAEVSGPPVTALVPSAERPLVLAEEEDPEGELAPGLRDSDAIWQVRSALNVAALNCRKQSHAAITSNYNLMLKRQRAVLAAAYAAEQDVFRRDFGKRWQSAHDAHATRTYNLFAQQSLQPRFCDLATRISARASSVEETAFPAFAMISLSRLRHPSVIGQ